MMNDWNDALVQVDYESDPILVCGMPRSGSTWMQHYLCQHPRVHVAGQFPHLPWDRFWAWYEEMVKHGSWACNHPGYIYPHWAGSSEERCRTIFKRTFCDYITGLNAQKPRWGGKFGKLCCDEQTVDNFESLWPEARWIICLRDPFISFSSEVNTFTPGADLKRWCELWVAAARFSDTHDVNRTTRFQIDRVSLLSQSDRIKCGKALIYAMNEEPTEETDRFIAEFDVVHKVKTDERRKRVVSPHDMETMLNDVADLETFMVRCGYSTTPCAH